MLTAKQAADLLKLSCGAVYALCKAGTLPHHRLGLGRGAIRISEEALDAFIKGATVRVGEAAEAEGATA